MIVRPEIVWPRPSKVPINFVELLPTGANPRPPFQPDVAEASTLPPSSYLPARAVFIHCNCSALWITTLPFSPKTTLVVVLPALKYTPPDVVFVFSIAALTLTVCGVSSVSFVAPLQFSPDPTVIFAPLLKVVLSLTAKLPPVAIAPAEALPTVMPEKPSAKLVEKLSAVICNVPAPPATPIVAPAVLGWTVSVPEPLRMPVRVRALPVRSMLPAPAFTLPPMIKGWSIPA